MSRSRQLVDYVQTVRAGEPEPPPNVMAYYSLRSELLIHGQGQVCAPPHRLERRIVASPVYVALGGDHA